MSASCSHKERIAGSASALEQSVNRSLSCPFAAGLCGGAHPLAPGSDTLDLRLSLHNQSIAPCPAPLPQDCVEERILQLAARWAWAGHSAQQG